MRIRSKLLIALTVIAIAPLLVAAIVGQLSTRSLGYQLADDSADASVAQATEQLQQIARDQATILRGRSLALLLSIELQCDAARDALTSSPPGGAVARAAREDFDQGRNPPPGLAPNPRYTVVRDGTLVPLPVSFEHQAYVPAPGVDTGDAEKQARRLTAMTPIYKALRSVNEDLVYWQYTCTEEGVHTGYPGHGGYPEGYDARQRSWYTQAVRTREAVWGPPLVDASTRQSMLTLSAPIEDASGQLLGVTGLDVRISDLVGGLRLPAEWSDDAEVYITSFHDWISNEEHAVPLIYAQHAYERDTAAQRSWTTPIQTEAFSLDDAEHLESLSEDLRASRGGILTDASRDGTRVLCVYVPVAEADQDGSAHLIITLPVESVNRVAERARNAVEGQTRAQLATNAAILVTCIGLALVVAFLGARHITNPIRSLVDAAARLGRGDFSARADVNTKDELEDLADTFNTMVPHLQERIRLADSLELARQLQQNLLPAEAPEVAGLDVAGDSDYCDETGGDYYDYIELKEDGHERLGVVIGDVTGHGIGPALLMATARALLRSRVNLPGTHAEQISDVNRYLTRDTIEGRFMTLAYLVIDPRDHTFCSVSAGHDAPLVYLPSTDGFMDIDTPDIPLGIDADWEYSQVDQGPLEPGCVIVLGTDGIWESRNEAGEMFGKDRLRTLIRDNAKRPASEIIACISSAISNFRGLHEQDDDVTTVVIKFGQTPDTSA